MKDSRKVAEKDGVYVPTTVEEYCVKTQVAEAEEDDSELFEEMYEYNSQDDEDED